MNHQCIKVTYLRNQLDLDGLDKWMDSPNNLYVGRNGRVFIHRDGEKIVFHYKGSKWQNPYKVGKDLTLDESLISYYNHLVSSGLINELEELEGKSLGCFCNPDNHCHAKLLCHLVDNEKYPEMEQYVI